jgi:hypothetical protein
MSTNKPVFLHAAELGQHYPELFSVRRGIILIAGEYLRKPYQNLLVSSTDAQTQLQELEQECQQSGVFPCYFGTNEAFAVDSLGMNYRHALLGAEARWSLANWKERQHNNRNVKASIHAAQRHGVKVEECRTYSDTYSILSDNTL